MRRTIHLGKGFRINISKSGISFSGGVRGFRVLIGPRGIRKTISVPGTGWSSTKTLVTPTRLRQIRQSLFRRSKDLALDPAAVKIKPTWLLPSLLSLLIGLLSFFTYQAVGGLLITIGAAGILRTYTSKQGKGHRAFNQAVKAISYEKYEEALEFLSLARTFLKGDYDTHLLIALILHQRKQAFKEALKHYDICDAIEKNALVCLLRAECYLEMGESQKAYGILITLSLKGDAEDTRHEFLKRIKEVQYAV